LSSVFWKETCCAAVQQFVVVIKTVSVLEMVAAALLLL
jgi:hypothetical protein